MLRTSATLISIAALCLLQACTAATPVEGVMAPVNTGETRAETVPELTLNLPKENCTCVAEGQTDYTFLERGFTALAEGDHIEAVHSFQRYQRLEDSPEAQLEAKIAIAYMSTLTKSPFYDPVEARRAHRRLYKQLKPGMEVHQKILFMRDSLETFGVMQRHIVNLEAQNSTLAEDLAKREEALKRLRELALGQPAAQQ
ncbi:MAG: hypothetical protein IMF06_14830 [Proteobacteria bacterium]|nr:hypothetical protein [Pseudomonadota bacterium]